MLPALCDGLVYSSLWGLSYASLFPCTVAGVTFQAFNPNLLGDADGFKQRAGRIVDLVRGSKRLPGVDRVYTPGEKGDELMEARIKAGKLDVETNLLASLAKAAVRVPSKL